MGANILQPYREAAGGINTPVVFLSSNPLREPPTDGAQQEARGPSLRTQSSIEKGATRGGLVVQIETNQHIVFGQFLNTKQTTSVKQ